MAHSWTTSYLPNPGINANKSLDSATTAGFVIVDGVIACSGRIFFTRPKTCFKQGRDGSLTIPSGPRFGVQVCLLFSTIILFLTRKPSSPYKIDLPYTTFLHAIPLLCILITISATVSYLHIGNFMWNVGTEPTWGDTVGLRLFVIVPSSSPSLLHDD